MDSLPLAFYDAVAATSKRVIVHNFYQPFQPHRPHQQERPRVIAYNPVYDLSSPSWTEAYKKQEIEQKVLKATFSFCQNEWRYMAADFETNEAVTLEQLQQFSWENLRFRKFEFHVIQFDGFKRISFVEMEELFRSVRPCLDDLALSLPTIAPPGIDRLLSYWHDLRSIATIEIKEFCDEYEKFFIEQSKSETLKSVTIQSNRWTQDMQKAIEEYIMTRPLAHVVCPALVCEPENNSIRFKMGYLENVEFLKSVLSSVNVKISGFAWSAKIQVAIETLVLTQPFKKIDCSGMNFFMLFFERLFEEVRVKTGRKTFIGKFYATMETLQNFRKNQQIVTEDRLIVWVRDEIKISVSCDSSTSELFEINFELFD